MGKNKQIRVLKKGDYFGENQIYWKLSDQKTYWLKTDCNLLSISAETLKNMIGPKIQRNSVCNFMKMAMTESIVFKKFNLEVTR